jgi:hypothetical protein
MDYIIVLFKNKVKKKIIKKFKTLDRAQKFYNNLLSISDEVIFDKQYENGHHCKFELGLLGPKNKNNIMYVKDEFGRQNKIEVEDEDYSMIKINPYNIDEEFIDYSTKDKINTDKFIKKYLKSVGLKMVSKLNNKIIVQLDEKTNLFTFKTESDSSRFIDNLSKKYINEKRMDCIFIKDSSTPQRKYLYDMLSNLGYPKQYLFRQSTTFPPKK